MNSMNVELSYLKSPLVVRGALFPEAVSEDLRALIPSLKTYCRSGRVVELEYDM
jgi:hypothetical protein